MTMSKVVRFHHASDVPRERTIDNEGIDVVGARLGLCRAASL